LRRYIEVADTLLPHAIRADASLDRLRQVLMDSARHVIGCRLTQKRGFSMGLIMWRALSIRP
jgi:hypothetical protein